MTTTSRADAQARETARHTDGRFGEQPLAEGDLTLEPDTVLHPKLGDLTQATPVAIDAEVADVHRRTYPLLAEISELNKWARPKMRQAYRQELIDRKLARRDQLLEEVEAIKAELVPLEAEYARRGTWTRYFVVEHLHTSQYCSSFRPTTRVGWLPAYSGRSPTEMIAEAGDMVCTKCVPDAPVAGKRPTIPELAKEWDKKHPELNPNVCGGSGTYLDSSKPHRAGYYSGNWGTCPDCGDAVTLTAGNRLRKHKPKPA